MDKESVIVIFIFFAHLFLIIWSLVGFPFSNGYLIYNFFFLLSLLWSVHNNKSSTPMFVSLFTNLLAIIMDVILIGVGFTARWSGALFVLSTIAAFINLALRLVTSYIIFRIYEQKRDNDGEAHESFEAVMTTMKGYFTPIQVQPQNNATQPSQPQMTQNQHQTMSFNSYPRA